MYPLILKGRATENDFSALLMNDNWQRECSVVVQDGDDRATESFSLYGGASVARGRADDYRRRTFYLVSIRDNLNVFYVPEPLVVRWKVRNPLLFVRHLLQAESDQRKEFDAVSVLARYFARTETNVPAVVGGPGVDEDMLDPNRSNRFARLREMLETDPPDMPGIEVSLDDATFGLPKRIRTESPDQPGTRRTRRSAMGPRPRFPEFPEEAGERGIVDAATASTEDESHVYVNQDLSTIGAAPRASIWTSGTEQQGLRIKAALKAILQEHYILLLDASRPRLGSWWQSFVMAMQRAMKTKTFQDHMQEFDHRLQMELVDKTAADINTKRSASVAELLAAIKDVDEVAMHVYQTVIIKCDGRIIVRTIDAEAARLLERSPEMLSDPRLVMQLIADINRHRLPIVSGSPATVEGEISEG